MKSDWITALGASREATVTVWLSSGRQVTGIIEEQFPDDDRNATVFKIKEAPLVPNGANSSQPSPPGQDGKYVLVPVKDIQLIDIK